MADQPHPNPPFEAHAVWKLPQLIYGGDYNPEQWDESIWREDVQLMQEAGVNLVSLGVFAWAKLEPQPGVYVFDWLDDVFDLLHNYGIAVNLATPTASPPPWFVRQHPEVLPVQADGTRLWHGSRRHVCPHCAAYRWHAAEITRQLARRYAQHPALALWHIDNEYGCHMAECFCDTSALAFQEWLRERYLTLDALNGAWGTTFWGQIYGDWAEIAPPRSAPTFIHPGHQLDWKRFCSDSWLECFEEQRAILREITPDIPLTTNFMGFFKPIDYWAWAAREDVVANDCYIDPSDPTAPIQTAMTYDLMRSLRGGQPWLLMEQVTSHVNWRPQNTTKRPGQMRQSSYQALARGASGIMFFQWRASSAGGEQFHGAMLPHVGTNSRVWREVVTLGAELRQLANLRAARVSADVAILIDWHSWWALEFAGKPSADIRLIEQISAWYAPLFAHNITVDFVSPQAELSGYRLVLAPNLYLVDDAAAHNIEQFVVAGGTLVMGCFSGIADAQNRIRLGGYPAPWRALLGLRVEEFAPFRVDQTGVVRIQGDQRFNCQIWADVIDLEGAEALAWFASDYYAGRAAITRHAFGGGTSYYIGTCLDEAGLDWLLRSACAQAGVQPVFHAPPGVEAICRSDDTRSWLFLFNHTGESVTIKLEQARMNGLYGNLSPRTLVLEPFGVAVVEGEPQPSLVPVGVRHAVSGV